MELNFQAFYTNFDDIKRRGGLTFNYQDSKNLFFFHINSLFFLNLRQKRYIFLGIAELK
jgi:hypothetical protein